MDEELKKTLLYTLRDEQTDSEVIEAARKRIDRRTLVQEVIAHFQASYNLFLVSPEDGWKEPEQVRKMIEFIRLLRISGIISEQEYAFYVMFLVERIHDERSSSGQYKSEIEPILAQIEEIRSCYGLSQDEYWPRGEGPPEYEILEAQYSEVLDGKLIETLREFRLSEIAELKATSPNEYEVLRERGRRHIFHREDLIEIVEDIVSRYEEDAKKSAESQAYFAASIALGASLEGVFLLRCLKSKSDAWPLARELGERKQDPTKWRFNTLIEVCIRGGWLPSVKTSVGEYDSAKLAHFVRDLRNLVHPGKQALKRPWLESDEQEYRDAEAIYILLKESIRRGMPENKKDVSKTIN